MAMNVAPGPPTKTLDPEQEEEMGFTTQQLCFLRQIVQDQPREERPRTSEPTPGEMYRVHVLSSAGWLR